MTDFRTYKLDDNTYWTIQTALCYLRDEAQHIADTCGNVEMRLREERRALEARHALQLLDVQREDDE